MSEKIFSIQDMASAMANVLRLQQKDLIDSIEGKDLSSIDAVTKHFKDFSDEQFREQHKQGVDKGFRQGAKKIENLFFDTFGEHTTGKNLEEVITQFKAKNTPQSEESKQQVITLKDALKNPEIATFVKDLQTKAADSDKTKADFENYKKTLTLKNKALQEFKTMNLDFSTNSGLKELQEQKLEQVLSSVGFREEQDGSITLLDADKEPLFNSKKAAKYTFNEFLSERVNFLDVVTKQPTIQDKPNTPPTPNTAQNSGFGFAENHVFTADDHRAALLSKEVQKADFIMQKILTQK